MKKRNFIFCFLLATAFAVGAKAQDAAGDEGVTRKLFQAQHRTVVSDNLNLTEAQSKPFWKIYDEYELERKSIGEKKIELLKKFIANIDSNNATTAANIINGTIDNQMDYLKLQKKYFKRISKEISPMVAARFMQIEQTINARISSDILSELPLAGSAGQ